MTPARDNRRQRLYDAEDAAGVRAITSPAGRRFLIDEARLIPQDVEGTVTDRRTGRQVAASIEDAQRYVDHVTHTAWFQRRYGQIIIQARWKAGGSATASPDSTIALPPWSRTEGPILHEIAHVLVMRFAPPHAAHHGPEFAGILLDLIRHQMGAEHARSLRVEFRARRVQVKASAVPKPTRAVVTTETLRAKRRALDATPPSQAQIREAASVVRRAVTAGLLGPAGRKPREHALATARALEAHLPTPAPAGTQRVYAARPRGWRQ